MFFSIFFLSKVKEYSLCNSCNSLGHLRSTYEIQFFKPLLLYLFESECFLNIPISINHLGEI